MKAKILDPTSKYFNAKLEIVGKHTLKNEHLGWRREMIRVALTDDLGGKWLAFPRESVKIE